MAVNSLFTLEDIATQVALNYGDQTDFTIEKAKKWVNRALLRINEMGDWSWLMVFDATFNTASGTEAYTLADGVKRVYSLFITSSTARRKLKLVDDRRFREVYTNTVTPQGTPHIYRLYGRSTAVGFEGRRKVALWPVPNATYAMYYDYRREIPLFTDALDASGATVMEVTGMPAHMVDALIELATAISFRELDDSDYESAMAEAMARWNNLLADDLTEIDDSIRMRAFNTETSYFGDPVLPPQYGDT